MKGWTRTYEPPDDLTKLERAVVDWALGSSPILATRNNKDLLVHRREWTVVGWFVDFSKGWRHQFQDHEYGYYHVDVLIEGVGIQHGAMAHLFILNAPTWDLLGMELLALGDTIAENVTEFALSRTK